MSAKKNLLPLIDAELEKILNASDFSDVSDSEDNNGQIESDFDSDDSIADKDYIPDKIDEDEYNEELEHVWNLKEKGKQGKLAKKYQAKKASQLEPSTSTCERFSETSKSGSHQPEVEPSTSASDEIFEKSHAKKLRYSFDTLEVDRQVPSSKPASNQISESISVNNEEILGKNGYRWFSSPIMSKKRKTPEKNVVYIRPGPRGEAKNVLEPVSAFSLYFDNDILSEILFQTNNKIAQLQARYKTKKSTISETSMSELKALMGLIILSAGLKDNHLSADILFDEAYSSSRYRATMSKERFHFLINALRFDEAGTREQRKKESSFAPILEIWNLFIKNCSTYFKPSAYITIDEQLVGFRGRCPFRMYLPNKPNKYGIKIVMLCDVATKYVINANPYLGKSTKTDGAPLADYFVENLTQPVWGSNRNITMDNWFTSVSLTNKLLGYPYKLTAVGTMRKNKPHIPMELLEDKDRECGKSVAVFDANITLISYKAKRNKNVFLLSSMHSTNAINPTTLKPEIVHVYNSTKGAVDTFDQMAQNMCCNRKTRRWPLCVFYNMMNIAAVNSYIIYHHNVIVSGKKPKNRLQYMLQLQEELTRPWQETRLQISSMPSHVKKSLFSVLEKNPTKGEEEKKATGRRTYCSQCPIVKKRMTTTYCYNCPRALCGEHQIKICSECLN